MWGVVYDWPKVVRHNKDWATFSYWKSWGPKLLFHHVVNQTGRGGVCFANISLGRGGVFAVGFSRQPIMRARWRLSTTHQRELSQQRFRRDLV